MTDRPIEKLVGALQRDRLTDFVKEADIKGDSCFYDALISCYNYLYPTKLLPRDVSDDLKKREGGGFGTKVKDVVSEIKRLEPIFHLRVDHVINHSNSSIKETRQELSLSDDIPVIEMHNGTLAPKSGHSTGIIFLIKNDEKGGHYMALAENPRFQESGIVIGGNSEISKIKDKYKTGASFILVKSDK